MLLGLKGLTFGRSFRSTAAEAFSRASKTNLLAFYFSSLLFFLKDDGVSRFSLLISNICSAALKSLDLFSSDMDVETRSLIW